jgi:hypothetical protein
MLLGILPVGAMAATGANYIYFDNSRVYDDSSLKIDIDDYLYKNQLYLDDLAKEFDGGTNIYSIDVAFYSSSSYAASKKISYGYSTTYDYTANTSIYCELSIEYATEKVDGSWYATYYVELYWSGASSGKYSITAEFDKDYVFTLSDFGLSKNASSYDLEDLVIYIDKNPTGTLSDYQGKTVTSSTKIEPQYFGSSNYDELSYYCSSRSNSSLRSDSFVFSIYDSYTGKWLVDEATMYISFGTTSSSGEKDFYLGVTSGKDTYFTASLFSDPGAYSYDLNKYTLSRLQFTVETLPVYGGIYYNAYTQLKVGDTYTLDEISKLSYYVSSGSKTDSMTFSLYDASSKTTLVSKAMLYFVFDQDTAKSFTVNLTSGKAYNFTLSDFTSNFTAGTTSGSLKYVKILSLPSYGTLKLGSTAVKKNDVIEASRLSALVYEPTDTVTKDAFVYAASSTGTLYSPDAAVSLNGTYTPTDYTVSTSGTLVTVTYSSTAPSSTTVSKTLSSADVTYLVSKANGSGSTLLVSIPFTSTGVTGVGRSLTIDKSLFSGTNLSTFSRVILVDTTSNADCIYLTVPTAGVATLYNTYSGDFTMSLSPTDLTTDDKSAAAASVGITRDVDMTIGTLNVDPAGAELSLPYLATNDHYTSVVMVRKGYQSYEPVLDSTWSDNMPYLTSTTSRPYVTCSVQSNKIYVTTVNSQTYTDMASTHWGYNFIRYLSARGILSGYAGTDAGKVKPDAYVTRAQFIKMLVVALDLYNSNATTTYTDITGSASWATSYIGSAQTAGIVKDSGTSFRPNDNITREEMALYAYRAASAAGITLSQTNAAVTFTDAAQISTTEMATAITAMQRAGIISGEAKNGVATGAFNPSGNTTRAAAAKIISMIMAPDVTIPQVTAAAG